MHAALRVRQLDREGATGGPADLGSEPSLSIHRDRHRVDSRRPPREHGAAKLTDGLRGSETDPNLKLRLSQALQQRPRDREDAAPGAEDQHGQAG